MIALQYGIVFSNQQQYIMIINIVFFGACNALGKNHSFRKHKTDQQPKRRTTSYERAIMYIYFISYNK